MPLMLGVGIDVDFMEFESIIKSWRIVSIDESAFRIQHQHLALASRGGKKLRVY